jgi:hypothetical protein
MKGLLQLGLLLYPTQLAKSCGATKLSSVCPAVLCDESEPVFLILSLGLLFYDYLGEHGLVYCAAVCGTMRPGALRRKQAPVKYYCKILSLCDRYCNIYWKFKKYGNIYWASRIYCNITGLLKYTAVLLQLYYRN